MDFLYKILSMRAFNSPLSCRINSECIHDRVSPQSAMFLGGPIYTDLPYKGSQVSMSFSALQIYAHISCPVVFCFGEVSVDLTHTIDQAPVEQPWRVWVKTSRKYTDEYTINKKCNKTICILWDIMENTVQKASHRRAQYWLDYHNVCQCQYGNN